MQLQACSVYLRQLGDPLISLVFSTDVTSAAASQEAGSVVVYNRRNLSVTVACNSAQLPLPKKGTPSADELGRFQGHLLGIAEAVRSAVGSDRDFHGKAAAHPDGEQLTFHYAEGSPKSSNQLMWHEPWTRTPRSDFPLTVRAAVGFEGELRFRAGEFLRELLKRVNNVKRGTMYSSDFHESENARLPYESDGLVVDDYRACFCFRFDTKARRMRALCWLHPEWPGQRLPRTGRRYGQWLRKRLETAAANNYLCELEGLTSGDERDEVAKIINAADGDKEDMPLFFLAVESHSFSIADWLLEFRNKRRLRSSEDGRQGGTETPAIDTYNRWGDTVLTRCCGRGGDPDIIAYLLSRGSDRLHQCDVNGNTALHRLAASLPSTVDPEEVRSVLNALLMGLSAQSLAEWLAKENHSEELAMALVSNTALLEILLDALGMSVGDQSHQTTSTANYLSLLRCSNGFSLAHSLAAFDSLQTAEPVIIRRFGFDAWKQLLSRACSGGYTPMHAACQAGKWINVSYLMHYLNAAPPSACALDLAIRERQLVSYQQFKEFFGVGFGGSGASLDSEAAALTVLDRAEDCLAFVNTGEARVQSSGLRHDWSAVAALSALRSTKTSTFLGNRDPVTQCALVALDEDSAASFRGLLGGSRGGSDGIGDGGETDSGGNRAALAMLLQSLESHPELLQWLHLAPEEGTGKPGCLHGLLGLALRRKKWRLAGDLLPARQFDLLPACLGIMLAVQAEMVNYSGRTDEAEDQPIGLIGRRGSTVDVTLPAESAQALYNQAKHIFCCALQRLYRGAQTEAHKGLVFNYLGGRFHGANSAPGPLFSGDVIRGGEQNRSLFELMLLTREPELLALDCTTDYVDLLLASPRNFCCHRCRDENGDRRLEGPSCSTGPIKVISSLWPEQGAKLRRKMPRGCTPQISMLLFALFNLLFLGLLGYYVHEVGESRSSSANMFMKVLLLLFGLSYSAQEFHDYRSALVRPGSSNSKQLCRRLVWYLSYRWNLVDIAAVTLLLTGIIWVFVLDATTAQNQAAVDGLSYYFARLCFALSFIFYCMRMLSSLSYFERLGLYISITKTTIVMDVVPFLIVNAFFLASFGVLIVCLLFPGGQTFHSGGDYSNPTPGKELSTGTYITEIFQRPLLAHFGEYGMDSLRQCERTEESKICPHPLGNKIYTRFVLFIYLLIVTVVFVNVLIAKLSLTVGKEDERARVIWRRFRAQLLTEFGRGNRMPAPPLILLIYKLALSPVALWRYFSASRKSPTNTASNTSGNYMTNSCGSIAFNARTGAAGVEASASPGSLLSRVECANRQESLNEPASPWWIAAGGSSKDAPPDFREFLWFQAMQFRTVRQKFSE